MNVPFLDLAKIHLEIEAEINSSISSFLSKGIYILGEEVERFEQNWARYCGAVYCVGLASGLDAITLALKSLEIGEGDEVIVPNNTFIATWLAVTQAGAKPVGVEPDIETYCINPSCIRNAITERTKAIIAVHLYGHPCEMNEIMAIAEEANCFVIEDAAQAHGAEYQGRRIGTHGDVTAWSFYPGKNLGAYGDAGAITTSNAEIAEKIRLLRNYGSSRKYYNEITGYNSRMDGLQAAILNVKIKYLAKWGNQRSQIASTYINQLSDCSFKVPEIRSYAKHAWHLFVIRNCDREALNKYLLEAGIQSMVHYPVPPYRQKAYMRSKGSFILNSESSLTDILSDTVLSLPMGPHIDEDQQSYVIHKLRHYDRQHCRSEQ
jgi:dTDP-4-amino-4,6-dideoxygalactose transaminase